MSITEIKSFKGITYNTDKIKDISNIFCPPYDVISKKDQDMYYKISPNNFIRIVLGKSLPKDNTRENKYIRAKNTFQRWLKGGILKQDKEDCLYFYSQEYIYKGERKNRLGFIGLLKLRHPQKKSKIFPHENTHLEAKKDRFQLIKMLKANLSPIFVLFADKDKWFERIFHKYLLGKEPFIDTFDVDKIRTKLWRLSNDEAIKQLREYMKDKSIYIADGHHRYEVAQSFCYLMSKNKKNFTGKEDFNYIMTYFTDLWSRDLQILPIHRVVKKLSLDIDVLQGDFSIEKVNDKYELFILLRKAGIAEHAFGFYKDKKFYLLRFNHPSRLDHYISVGSREFKNLDVSILQFIIFKKLKVKDKDLIFIKDEDQTISMVDEKKAEAVFFLNPVKISQLRAIATGGEKMPPKSTYFYPKLLCGLVINKFDSID